MPDLVTCRIPCPRLHSVPRSSALFPAVSSPAPLPPFSDSSSLAILARTRRRVRLSTILRHHITVHPTPRIIRQQYSYSIASHRHHPIVRILHYTYHGISGFLRCSVSNIGFPGLGFSVCLVSPFLWYPLHSRVHPHA